MMKKKLSQLTPDELVQVFETLCIAQYESLEAEEISAFNRRYGKIQAVQDELKSRTGDQRRLLQRFFDHPNLQVRLTAAHANLVIDYSKARAVFEEISENAVGVQKLSAGMTLQNLDDGIYRPS